MNRKNPGLSLAGLFVGATLTLFGAAATAVPIVTKNATTTFTRTYTWEITKIASLSEVVLATGATQIVEYTIAVNRTVTDSDWAVVGTINIENPDGDRVILSVSDEISGGIAASVTCPVGFPFNVSAGMSITCTYLAGLPDNADRTNTATATFGAAGAAPTSYTGSAAVTFGAPTTIVGYASIYVTDTYGESWEFNDSGSVTYQRLFGPYQSPYSESFTNTATITETGQSASATVLVTVIDQVPEPGTLALFGLGLAGLGLSRRRKVA